MASTFHVLAIFFTIFLNQQSAAEQHVNINFWINSVEADAPFAVLTIQPSQ